MWNFDELLKNQTREIDIANGLVPAKSGGILGSCDITGILTIAPGTKGGSYNAISFSDPSVVVAYQPGTISLPSNSDLVIIEVSIVRQKTLDVDQSVCFLNV